MQRQLHRTPAVPAFAKVDSMEARVQGCVTCHGQSGQGTNNGYFPRIAGKPAGYLYNQLVAFRDGTRQIPADELPRRVPARHLPARDGGALRQAAAAVSPRTTAARSMPATLARGQALVDRRRPAEGRSRRASPATARASPAWSPASRAWSGCGRPTSSAQLTRWRVGERHAAEPDCMKRIATRLSDTDITAVAAWLASQDAADRPVARIVQPRAHAVRMRQPAMSACARPSAWCSRWRW